MGDWFTDNAPPAQPQTQPQTHVLQPQAQASGDWFSQNAPTGPSLGLPQPGPTPTSQQTESAMKTVGRKALDYLPAVGATAGALLAPEGVLPAVGLAALGGAAGETARQGTLAATGDTEAPQSVGDAALNVGKSAAEQGAMELGGRLIAKPFEMIGKALAPERLYQSSLRPSLSKANLPKIDTEVATGLREGIPTSSKGLQIARDRIDALNDQIANEIANKSQQLGPVVQPSAVAQQVAPTRATFATQVNPQADLSAIDRATAEFME